MANQTWAKDASTIFFAAEPFLRISRQQLFTVGERHCARSGELPPTAKHLVAGRTDLSGDQQSGSSPYPIPSMRIGLIMLFQADGDAGDSFLEPGALALKASTAQRS